MRNTLLVFVTLCFAMPLLSFKDFIDYWEVKVNGKVVYNSSTEKKYNTVFQYDVAAGDLSIKDSIEVTYFTDTPCGDCVYTYFVSEFTQEKGKAVTSLHTYLKEQRSLGPKAYIIALQDLAHTGTRGTIKAIYYYQNINQPATALCYVNIK